MSLRLCHPGKFGDLLWALPTARAMAERAGEYASLYIPTTLAGIAPLLQKQSDYIGSVHILDNWEVQDTAPATPRTPRGREYMTSLGYRDWPTRPLPYEVAAEHVVIGDDTQFFRPWITAPSLDYNLASGRARVVVHWTDRWFELKLGILSELKRALSRDLYCDWCAAPGTRMADAGAVMVGWEALARTMAKAAIVLTDCSSAHVLAAALGVPNILVVEPETDRHHFIFWPGSTVKAGLPWVQRDTVLGRAIQPVLGNDGQPTFDSRHTIDAVRTALRS